MTRRRRRLTRDEFEALMSADLDELALRWVAEENRRLTVALAVAQEILDADSARHTTETLTDAGGTK